MTDQKEIDSSTVPESIATVSTTPLPKKKPKVADQPDVALQKSCGAISGTIPLSAKGIVVPTAFAAPQRRQSRTFGGFLDEDEGYDTDVPSKTPTKSVLDCAIPAYPLFTRDSISPRSADNGHHYDDRILFGDEDDKGNSSAASSAERSRQMREVKIGGKKVLNASNSVTPRLPLFKIRPKWAPKPDAEIVSVLEKTFNHRRPPLVSPDSEADLDEAQQFATKRRHNFSSCAATRQDFDSTVKEDRNRRINAADDFKPKPKPNTLRDLTRHARTAGEPEVPDITSDLNDRLLKAKNTVAPIGPTRLVNGSGLGLSRESDRQVQEASSGHRDDKPRAGLTVADLESNDHGSDISQILTQAPNTSGGFAMLANREKAAASQRIQAESATSASVSSATIAKPLTQTQQRHENAKDLLSSLRLIKDVYEYFATHAHHVRGGKIPEMVKAELAEIDKFSIQVLEYGKDFGPLNRRRPQDIKDNLRKRLVRLGENPENEKMRLGATAIEVCGVAKWRRLEAALVEAQRNAETLREARTRETDERYNKYKRNERSQKHNTNLISEDAPSYTQYSYRDPATGKRCLTEEGKQRAREHNQKRSEKRHTQLDFKHIAEDEQITNLRSKLGLIKRKQPSKVPITDEEDQQNNDKLIDGSFANTSDEESEEDEGEDIAPTYKASDDTASSQGKTLVNSPSSIRDGEHVSALMAGEIACDESQMKSTAQQPNASNKRIASSHIVNHFSKRNAAPKRKPRDASEGLDVKNPGNTSSRARSERQDLIDFSESGSDSEDEDSEYIAVYTLTLVRSGFPGLPNGSFPREKRCFSQKDAEYKLGKLIKKNTAVMWQGGDSSDITIRNNGKIVKREVVNQIDNTWVEVYITKETMQSSQAARNFPYFIPQARPRPRFFDVVWQRHIPKYEQQKDADDLFEEGELVLVGHDVDTPNYDDFMSFTSLKLANDHAKRTLLTWYEQKLPDNDRKAHEVKLKEDEIEEYIKGTLGAGADDDNEARDVGDDDMGRFDWSEQLGDEKMRVWVGEKQVRGVVE